MGSERRRGREGGGDLRRDGACGRRWQSVGGAVNRRLFFHSFDTADDPVRDDERMMLCCCGARHDEKHGAPAKAAAARLTVDTEAARRATDPPERQPDEEEAGGLNEPPATPVGRDELALKRHRFFSDLMAVAEAQDRHRVRFDPRGPSVSGTEFNNTNYRRIFFNFPY